MRKIFLIFIGIMVLILLASPVCAGDYNEIINYTEEATYGHSVTTTASYVLGDKYLTKLRFPSIENWHEVTCIEIIEEGTNVFVPGTATGTFTAKLSTGGDDIGAGSFVTASGLTGDAHDRYSLYFSWWDAEGLSGNKEVYLTITAGTVAKYTSGSKPARNTYSTAPTIGDESNNYGVGNVLHQTTFETPYKANITIEETDLAAEGGYDLTYLTYARSVAGINYPSTIDARSNDTIYINNYYAASGTNYAYIDRYPTEIKVSFGYPTAIYWWNRTLIGDNPALNLVDVAPTPTATPTATLTPVPELCGYWSLAVNTSNIVRNGYVQGTLTESDPSDRFDMIDWYRVLPSGEEILALHYVYDPGFFGLGAGWYEVSPTGVATASSEAAAKQNTVQFTTSGGAHHLRAKIYDDVSLVPTVYHDYSLVCTLSQVVYVGETIQSTTEQGINVYEADTNALLSSVSLNVYDQNTGEWQNKTSPVGGGTTYFNVVPGHILQVHATKSGWIPFDGSITVASPPVPYPIYLKRPLVDVVNQSYAHFNVRDSLTREGIYQATIMLSNGQGKKTMPSGYAGFSVNDSETYYYTVTKSGYLSFSDSFSITDDTTFQVLLESTGTPPTTLTYPITTLPTVTAPTATPTLVDTDGDGTPDIVDNDDDNDGIPDSSDTDDDDDGIPDTEEVTPTPTVDDDDITESERTSARQALKEAYAFVPQIFGFVLLILFLAIMKRGMK